MQRSSRENPQVREFILRNIENYPESIASVAAERFHLSRVAINGYLNRLIRDRLVEAAGMTKARRYALKPMVDLTFEVPLSAHTEAEDAVWRFRILPHIAPLKDNVRNLCQYGFTEILNNAMDHSGSAQATVIFQQTYTKVTILVEDRGVGIFERIKRDFGLSDARTALLELSKGMLTSDARRHAGEGIFYTSRLFDEFRILSHTLFYSRKRQPDSEWLIDVGEEEYHPGTTVFMAISTAADWTLSETFQKYRSDDARFRKTQIPVKIGVYPGEQLVSRSQAKRVLARFEKFSEVVLDFQGIDQIGQAFADEIFRVFPLDHPEVHLDAVNTNPEIRSMIAYVLRGEDGSPKLL